MPFATGGGKIVNFGDELAIAMHTCPHCEKPGITFLEKLLCNMSYPAKCSFCSELAVKSAAVGWAQLLVGVAFALVAVYVPTMLPRQYLVFAGAFVAVLLGQIAPLRAA